jgi:FKBP-type peptidyl-prolyl cis-trans isomerase FkpA
MNCPSILIPLRLLAAATLAAGLLLPALSTAQLARPASAPADAGAVVTTSSGLVFKLMKQGKGPSPQASDTVKVHYRGTFADGKEFDSSYSRGAPAEFPLSRVIKCWTEGVQRLQVGGSARLTCPPAIAYGERGAGGVIPPNATLTFDIELLAIVK